MTRSLSMAIFASWHRLIFAWVLFEVTKTVVLIPSRRTKRCVWTSGDWSRRSKRDSSLVPRQGFAWSDQHKSRRALFGSFATGHPPCSQDIKWLPGDRIVWFFSRMGLWCHCLLIRLTTTWIPLLCSSRTTSSDLKTQPSFAKSVFRNFRAR